MESRSIELIADNIARIRESIASVCAGCGRSPDEILLMAVTKTRTAEEVNAAAACGITLFGENRAQELRDRFDSYSFGAEAIHFIGTLQQNKLKYLTGRCGCVESINSLAIAQELGRRCVESRETMDIMLEVNIGAETAKSGIDAAETVELAASCAEIPGLRVRGLMCIPPLAQDERQTAQYFEQMRKLFIDIKHKKIDNISMDYLSMGMSGDYRTAVKCGSNLLRIGTGIFGLRS